MSTYVAETATLVHGYTMADVDKAARFSATRAHAGQSMSWEDKFDVAWMAIVEAIYESADRPTDLRGIGLRAVSDEASAQLRHHGLNGRQGDFTPTFRIYWHHQQGGGHSFADGVDERLALAQVLGQLTPRQYETISTLAAFGNSTSAAAALGLKPATFARRLHRARAAIFELWYAPETPRDMTQRRMTPDGQCTYGHALSEHGVVYGDGRFRCRLCRRNEARRRMARMR